VRSEGFGAVEGREMGVAWEVVGHFLWWRVLVGFVFIACLWMGGREGAYHVVCVSCVGCVGSQASVAL
jgi:hypothetical protein